MDFPAIFELKCTPNKFVLTAPLPCGARVSVGDLNRVSAKLDEHEGMVTIHAERDRLHVSVSVPVIATTPLTSIAPSTIGMKRKRAAAGDGGNSATKRR